MAYAKSLAVASTYLKPKEAAALLGLHPKGVYDLIAHGRITAVDVTPDPKARRRTYRISQEEMDRFLKGSATTRRPALRKTRTPAAAAPEPDAPTRIVAPAPANDQS